MNKIQPELFDSSNFKSPYEYSKDYLKTASYLDKLLVHGIKPGLERIEILAKKLGNPQFLYPVIQVTGTNGKSSVVKMISAILNKNGLKIGAYTSPHLFSYRERISVNNKMIR